MIALHSIEKVFIDLIHKSVFDESYALGYSLNEDMTRQMIELSKRHFCHAFIRKAFKLCNAEMPSDFDRNVKLLMYRNLNYLSVQNKIINILNENGIDCVVLKGSSVSECYKEPLLRILGDIDVLVEEKDFDKAIDILLGGNVKDEKSAEHKFHYHFRFEGFSVEIHKHINEHENDDVSADVVQNWIKERQTSCLEGYEFPVLKTVHQALCLLLHIKRHLKEHNVNLRLLLDWIAFAGSVEVDFWNENVYPELEKFKLNKLSDALLCLSDECFKTDNTEKTHTQFSEEINRMLIGEFMSSGYGESADKSSGIVAAVYAESGKKGKISRTIDTLNRRSRRWFKISRYKILLPLCWLLLAVRYVFGVLTGRRQKVSFIDVMHAVARKEKLYKELELND